MATYLVTYDLNKEVSRPPIVDHIRSFESWIKFSESSYAIATLLSAEALYRSFAHLLDDNDTLLVVALSTPYFGQAIPAVHDWLESNL